MNGFQVFDGNAGQYDTRTSTEAATPKWDIGTSLLLANIDDDVKIFAPSFKFLLHKQTA